MLKRVNEILIGKDITRTAGTIGADLVAVQENIVDGEVLVLDKDFAEQAAPTFAATNLIYIAQGTAESFSYVNEAGTAATGTKLLLSDAIHGDRVRVYSGALFTPTTEQVTTFPAITDTIVAGTEYVLRLVYKDLYERPAPFTQTYRYVAKTGDTSPLVFDGLRKRIAKHTGRLSIKGGTRVTTNALAETTLILTGKVIPECTTSVNDIDELTQVYFEAYLNYVDSDGIWTELGLGTAKSTVQHVRGNGVWTLIRDVEKHAQSYKGIENRIWFPVLAPAMRVIKGAEYGEVIIEHDPLYRSSDNQYIKSTPKTTVIAVAGSRGTAVGTSFKISNAVGLTTGNGLGLQVALNAYFESTPQAFANIDVFEEV